MVRDARGLAGLRGRFALGGLLQVAALRRRGRAGAERPAGAAGSGPAAGAFAGARIDHTSQPLASAFP